MPKKIDVSGLDHYHDKVSAMVADEYSSSATYAVGDYCFHAGTLYKCTTAITTAEAWTSGHWTAAKLAEDTSELKTAFADITDEYVPFNHAVLSAETPIVKNESVTVTFSNGSVNVQYPYDLGNPSVGIGLTGIEAGKTYNLSLRLVSGNVSKVRVTRMSTTSGFIAVLETATKEDNIYSVTFTPGAIPEGNFIGIEFDFMRSLSTNITFDSFSCYESGDVQHIYIPESALSDDVQRKLNGNYLAKVSFIGGDVSTSECTLIKFADGTTMAVDSGRGNRNLIYSEMARLGISHIDYLLISHYHSDHATNVVYFGQAGLFDEDTTFILPMYITDDMYTRIQENPPDWTIYQPEIIGAAQTYGCTIYRPEEDWESITIGDATVEFFNVDHTDWYEMTVTDYNDCSLCAYLTIGNTSILFSGDISLPVLAKYRKHLRHCTIYKANHHAEGYDVDPVFMGSVSPNIVVTMQGTRMITKTGTASIDSQFYYKSNGLQSWCEKYHVYNYLTSFNENTPIGICVNDAGYKFETKVRASNRFEEGIYAADDPDVPDQDLYEHYFSMPT